MNERLKEVAANKEEMQQKIKHKTQNRQNAAGYASRRCRKNVSAQEMQLSRLEAEIESAQNRIWEEYQLTYLNAAELRTKINMASAQQEIEEIKEEIRSMGNINPNAPEDLQARDGTAGFPLRPAGGPGKRHRRPEKGDRGAHAQHAHKL